MIVMYMRGIGGIIGVSGVEDATRAGIFALVGGDAGEVEGDC